jgi:hypothetical protein
VTVMTYDKDGSGDISVVNRVVNYSIDRAQLGGTR